MDHKLSIVHNPRSPIAEAFRSLRTNIQFSNIENRIRSIAVTSSIPGEGKSTVAFNLAASLAQTGKKVLLIDCDLRNPSIYKKTDLQNTVGLTNIIVQCMHYRDVLQRQDSAENLDIITSGPIPPNPSELLESAKMKELMETLAQEYDMIVIDSPPISLVTDAAILSTLVGGVVLVCEAGKTKTEVLRKSIDALNKVNANILGVVMNKVKLEYKSYYKSYYYYKE